LVTLPYCGNGNPISDVVRNILAGHFGIPRTRDLAGYHPAPRKSSLRLCHYPILLALIFALDAIHIWTMLTFFSLSPSSTFHVSSSSRSNFKRYSYFNAWVQLVSTTDRSKNSIFSIPRGNLECASSTCAFSRSRTLGLQSAPQNFEKIRRILQKGP
jgi:hypothetical protein